MAVPNPVIELNAPGRAPVRIGNGERLCVIAGPCQLESRAHALETAGALAEIAARLQGETASCRRPSCLQLSAIVRCRPTAFAALCSVARVTEGFAGSRRRSS